MSTPDAPPPLDYRTPPSPSSLARRLARPALIATAVVVVAALVLLVLLRPAGRRGDESPRAQCASNLHQIGLGILLFQQDHGGHYPASLAELISAVQVGPEVLVCPSANDTPAVLPPPPPGQTEPTTQAVAAALAVPGHVSYVYFGHADWTDAVIPPDAIIAAEPPSHHGGDGSTVLYGDGHADWQPTPRAARLIAAAAATTRPVSAATVK